MIDYFKILRLTAPGTEPVSLDEAKAQLRVDVNDDDVIIGTMISAARDMAEKYCNRLFAPASAAVLYNGLPSGDSPLHMPLPNVTSLDAMSYVDADNATQVISNPVIDADYQTIRPAASTDWPDDAQFARVEVTTEALIDESGVKAAILLYVTDLYEHRGTMTEVQIYSNKAAISLLQPYRVEMGV